MKQSDELCFLVESVKYRKIIDAMIQMCSDHTTNNTFAANELNVQRPTNQSIDQSIEHIMVPVIGSLSTRVAEKHDESGSGAVVLIRFSIPKCQAGGHTGGEICVDTSSLRARLSEGQWIGTESRVQWENTTIA